MDINERKKKIEEEAADLRRQRDLAQQTVVQINQRLFWLQGQWDLLDELQRCDNDQKSDKLPTWIEVDHESSPASDNA